MGISSSRTVREQTPGQDMNLEIGFNTNCPIRDTFFYSHVESLSRCERSIVGFRANSASPSDIYKIELNDADGNVVQNVIMKLFLVNDPFTFLKDADGNLNVVMTSQFTPRPGSGEPIINSGPRNTTFPLARINYEAQVYELVVYLEKIKKLVDYNICPYFVKVLGGNINIPALSIWNNLFTLPDGTLRPGININNFLRNIAIMRFSHIFFINGANVYGLNIEVAGRPEINNPENNTVIRLKSYPRVFTGEEETTRFRSLGLPFNTTPGFEYREENIFDYTIPPTDMINNLKFGYILTEEITDPSFTEVLNLIKLIDTVSALPGPNNSPYRILRNIEDSIINGSITQILFDNLIENLRLVIENINGYISESKIISKVRNMINDANIFFANTTLPNRNSFLTKVKNIRRFSMNIRADGTNIGNRLIKEGVFQVLIACYSMYLSGVAHNDLHTGNVFLKIYDTPITFHYVINENLYIINTICKPLIYDFDRAYVNNYNNELLVDNTASQNNILLNPKDFIKVLCYIRGININLDINNYLANVINDPDEVVRLTRLDNFYTEPQCFLQIRNPDGTVRSADRETDFNSAHRYRQLIINFGNIMGYNRNINTVVYSSRVDTYCLDTQFFDEADNFNKDYYIKYLIAIGHYYMRVGA